MSRVLLEFNKIAAAASSNFNNIHFFFSYFLKILIIIIIKIILFFNRGDVCELKRNISVHICTRVYVCVCLMASFIKGRRKNLLIKTAYLKDYIIFKNNTKDVSYSYFHWK